MRAGAVWCLFLFALAVEDVTVRASGATRGLSTDDKVAIVHKPTELLFGRCPKLPPSTMNVRLQALKTKSGAIFRRKTVTDDLFACLAALGSQPLAASSIRECSKQAEAAGERDVFACMAALGSQRPAASSIQECSKYADAAGKVETFACLAALGSHSLAASSIEECSKQTEIAGLKMFHWDGGLCTGYIYGIPVNTARCAGAGSVVLYSVNVEAISMVVSNITLAFSDISAINATWDVAQNSCFVAYRVSFNNRDTFVSDKLATVGLETAISCAEYPLTVTPVDATSAVIGPAATVKVVMPKALELSLNLTYGVSAVKASWRVEYACNPRKPPAMGVTIKSYEASQSVSSWTKDNSTFEHSFPADPERCSDTASTLIASLNEFTIQAIDGTGAELARVTATLTDTIMAGHRYLSDAWHCIYYQKLEETSSGVGFTYDQLLEFCQKTMFSNPPKNDVDQSGYMSVLTYLESLTPKVIVAPHYIGLKRNSTSGKWLWLSGVEQPVSNVLWDSGEPSTAGDCVELKANKKLAAISCDATNMATVCIDI